MARAKFEELMLGTRTYRYSHARRISGRPLICQYETEEGKWRDVRNIDRLDQLWKLADATCKLPLQVA